MKVIIGLGNVGLQYENTRHNTGFMVVNNLAARKNIFFQHFKQDCLGSSFSLNDEKIFLIKPTTFMNESGIAVKKIVNYYNLNLEDIVVVHDDMDLSLGRIKLKTHGSSGGHNGIKSITEKLGTGEYKRIRVGIGHPKNRSTVNYVLGKFTDDEMDILNVAIENSLSVILNWINNTSFEKLMNKYNVKK